MQHRRFGRTGWEVSVIGFGAWAVGGGWGEQRDEDSVAALNAALDLDVTFIDTAQGYGDGHSERVIARVLRDRGLPRGGGKVRVATKIPPTDGHWPPYPHDRWEERYPQRYLRDRVEQSLRDLDAEVLDVVQLHTWTRAWNRSPVPLEVLAELKQEGKLLATGISTPEHDQNALLDLVRGGYLDGIQVIYSIFEQEPAAELLPACQEHDVGVIVRVVFEEGALTGKFTPETRFDPEDFRSDYFRGDRLAETVRRVEAMRRTVREVSGGKEADLASVAARFALAHPAAGVVLTGIRNVDQARRNAGIADEPPLEDALLRALWEHNWQRGDWHC